ncbi:hypothetical protein [Streptomyces buecherae]|uniref:hypothetical protein n=1 Tax=Streptomyces buecherae TaxID=2763006 RepID=UPI0037AFD178
MKSTPDAPSPARQRPHAGAPAAGQHTGADTELAPTVGESPGVSRAVRTPPAPVSGGPGLDRRGLQRLQRAAGNAAVSRLVAQRYAAPVKPSPAQAPGFRRVKADVGAKKQTVKQHQPATTESKSAQDAAVAPPDDKEAQGKAAQAEKMNAAKPGEFNKQAFIDAVNKAIADQAPKNLNEADKFADSGKADQVKEQVDGKVTDGKKTSAKDIETTTKAAPDTSKAKTKKVTPMTADKPPGNPGAPSADDAVPDKQPPAVTDFSDGPKQNDKAMADAEVTEEQLAKGNEPQFDEALSEKKKAEEHSKKAGPQGRQAEDAELADAKAGAAAAGASAMASLTATRSEAGQKVDGGKGETKSKDEKKREEVTAKLQKVFDATKKDVESTLEGLDKKVDDQFTKGEKAAKDAFTEDHKRRMKKYKDKRYSGFRGKLRWVKDKFKGLPEEGLNIFKESRKLYVSKMQGVISSIADTIGTELGKAKARIKQGRSELKAEVDKLPEDLKKYGQEAAKDFEGKFEDLETKVNDKSDELVQTLAQKYTEALNKVDDEIKKLQDANKGLIAKAKDAIVGAIKTIMELRNLLMGILAKAASAIGKIIKDPIGFLGNLVKAVGAGLNLFTSNILDHLKKGLVAWLLGTATKEGIEIPAKFDMKGIIQLVGSMLGLTWDNLRARIVGKGVPEPAMEKVEQSVPVAGALSREGPAGAMDEIQADTGDLKTKILDDLKAYLVPTVIIAGISWIVSLLTPASAFVRAVKGIIDIITFIVNQGAQIVEFVNAVLDAVIAIAGGGSAGVPKMVEAALAASIPLLIGFLAALVGVGGLANKVKSVLRAAGRPVKRALDKLVGVIARKGKAIWGKIRNKGDGTGKPRKAERPKRNRKERVEQAKNSKTKERSKDRRNDHSSGSRKGEQERKIPKKQPAKDSSPIPTSITSQFQMEGHGHTLRLGPEGTTLASSLPRPVIDRCRARCAQIKSLVGKNGEYKALQDILTKNTKAINSYRKMGMDGNNPKVKRAFQLLKEAMEDYASVHGKIDIGADARWTPEGEEKLRGHLQTAQDSFASTGLSAAQIGDVERLRAEERDVEAKNEKKDKSKDAPWFVRYAMHQGTTIDESFKVAARPDPILRLHNVVISPRNLPKGTQVPDFYEKSKTWWGDVTTENSWQDHLNTYAPNFGSEALALIYAPMSYTEYTKKFPHQIGVVSE